MTASPLPQTTFGPDGPAVTRIGLGGEGVLRTFGEEAGAAAVVEEALARGVTYFDTARAYAGSETYLGEVWQRRPEDRKKVFHTSKSARRDRKGAFEDLEATLANLNTDYLDLWQIHDVRTEDDMRAIASPGGALEAFVEARESGRVKRIGVTGHHDPAVLTGCVRDWPLDAVLLPVNPAEGVLGGFLTETLPAARERNMAVIGMKVFGGGHYLAPQKRMTPQLFLRYALSQPVDVIIVGCSMPDHVRTMAEIAAAFSPMPEAAMDELHKSFSTAAAKMAYYRGTI